MVPHSFSTMHRVVDADRLRHRQLHAGEQVAQHRARGEAGDDAGDAGGGEQADAVLPHRLEGHQRGADRDDHHQHVGGAQQHAHLRDVLARQQVVVDVEPELPQVKIGGDIERGDRRPADQPDHRRSAAAAPAIARCPDRAARPACAIIIARMSRAELGHAAHLREHREHIRIALGQRSDAAVCAPTCAANRRARRRTARITIATTGSGSQSSRFLTGVRASRIESMRT